MKIKVGQLRQIIREVAEELGEAAEPAALKPVADKVLATNKSDLEAAFEDMTPEDLEALQKLAAGGGKMTEGDANWRPPTSKEELEAELTAAAADVQDIALAAGVGAGMLDVFKQCAVDYAAATSDLIGRVHGTSPGPGLGDFASEAAMVAGGAALAALTAATVLKAYKIWKSKQGTRSESVRLTPGLLRRIIKEEAEAAAAEELEATAGDWVADNYDAILAKLQADPKLADAILAAAGVNESYAGDLAKGVGDYYKGGALRGNINPMLIPGGGASLGYLGAEIMALVKDPSLMPWTELRSLQLDDKITMDGSAAKAMIVGALLGHLVDVARHAKKFADRSAAMGRARRRR